MKKRRAPLYFLLGLLLVLGLALSLNIFILTRPGPVTDHGQGKDRKKGRTVKRGITRSKSCKPKAIRPRVAIIIDDLGYNLDMAAAFMGTGLPLTLSILPLAPFTGSIAREAEIRGVEVLLHQPMEPRGYPEITPGPGALLLSMGPSEIERILHDNLKHVSGAKGINNHMGSRFTKNRNKMKVLAKALRKRSLFFVDSRTTRHTVGLEEMASLHVPVRGRDIFLDNELSPHAIDRQIGRLLSVAEKAGVAIGIGHPYWMTLNMLVKNRDRFKKEAEMVPVSALMQ